MNFVDTLPGMGKTDGAIGLMKKCVQQKSDICIYAAPTLDLLHQVEARLTESLGKKHPRVIPVHSEALKTDIPLCDEIVALLDGRDRSRKNNGAAVNRIKPGTVLLVTHKTFMELPKGIQRRPEVIVIFDEAYRCVFDPIQVKLSGKEAELFRNHIGIEESSREYLRVTKVSSIETIREELSKLDRKPNASLLFEMLDSVRKEISDVYVSITGDDQNKFEFQEVKIPSRMFDGWKCVYLMSAFLKTTQLWALLTRNYFVLNGEVLHTTQGNLSDASDWVVRKPRKKIAPDSLLVRVILTDVTSSFIPNYKKRLKEFERRYKDATIFCLTDAPLLSRNLLSSVLVSTEEYDAKQAELKALVTKLRGSDACIMVDEAPIRLSRSELIRYAYASAAAHRLAPQTKQLVSWFRSLNVVARTPYKWYLQHALDVANSWLKQHNYLVKTAEVTIEGKRYPTVIQQKPLVLLNVAEQEKVQRHHALRAKIELLPFECAGLNAYRDSQVVVFLAALNATPTHGRFYREVLPWYDPKHDYAVASAVQAITRGALRKNDSTDKVLIICADSEMANLLKLRLLGAPRVVNGWEYKIPKARPLEFSLTYSSSKSRMKKWLLDPVHAERRKAAVRRTSKKHYKLSEASVRQASPYYKQYDSLAYKLRNRKAALKNATSSRDEQAELGSLQEAVDDLRDKHRKWAREYRKELRSKNTQEQL